MVPSVVSWDKSLEIVEQRLKRPKSSKRELERIRNKILATAKRTNFMSKVVCYELGLSEIARRHL